MSVAETSVPPITVEDSDASELNSFLEARLYAFNAAATGFSDGTPLHAHIKDELGLIVAALSGHTWGGCCDISLLWVHELNRGRGLGQALLRAAEAEATRRGCYQVTLSTHSFQSPSFYEKLGYVRVGEIPNYPYGHTKIYYVKRLPPE